MLRDWFTTGRSAAKALLQTVHASWHLHFHPAIRLVSQSPTQWHILHDNRYLAMLETTLPFRQEVSWYSSGYGHGEKSVQLMGIGRGINRYEKESILIKV